MPLPRPPSTAGEQGEDRVQRSACECGRSWEWEGEGERERELALGVD